MSDTPTPIGTNAPPPYPDLPRQPQWTYAGGVNTNLPAHWPPWYVYPLRW